MRVAVVEDNLDLLDEMVFQLEHAGFAVTGCADGVALDACFAGPDTDWPDTLIIDLHLPGESGVDICRRMRAAHPELAMILLSAASFRELAALRAEAFACACLQKPVDMQQLVAELHRLG